MEAPFRGLGSHECELSLVRRYQSFLLLCLETQGGNVWMQVVQVVQLVQVASCPPSFRASVASEK
jgi:hypothetical protein